AKRGAVENPCADVPWHHVQFHTGRDSPANSGPAKEKIATIANFDFITVTTQLLAPYTFMETLQKDWIHITSDC
ncbi:MAG TPA: hypothetical protein VKE72_08050, partial [Methylocella sp.]|nr:hypothetical protein [Methylocella sp.]